LLAATFAIGSFTAPYFVSSRLVVPEVTGEDEHAVAEVNAVLAGGNQITQIAGPVLAGVLIAATSPAAVLVVDGSTYVFSFLTIAMPWPAAMVVIGAFSFFAPLVNAPIIGVLTVRTPPELRPKVMTAVMTIATVAGPPGSLSAGFALGHVSVYLVFFVIAAAL